MSLFNKYSIIAERIQDREKSKELPVKRPFVPLHCMDCWAEYDGVCFAMIRGTPCLTAIKLCEYRGDVYKKVRRWVQ